MSLSKPLTSAQKSTELTSRVEQYLDLPASKSSKKTSASKKPSRGWSVSR